MADTSRDTATSVSDSDNAGLPDSTSTKAVITTITRFITKRYGDGYGYGYGDGDGYGYGYGDGDGYGYGDG